MVTPRRFVTWLYTADDGRTYQRKVAADIVSQTDEEGKPLVGGAPATNADYPWPGAMKPRHVSCSNGNGVYRDVVCFDPHAPLWKRTATRIMLTGGIGEPLSPYFVYGNQGERSRHHIPRGIPTDEGDEQ
jgi:hypothetical protein